MIETSVPYAAFNAAEAELRDGLARSNAAVESVVPILRHLLASDDNALFSDEIVARVRGMVRDIAVQVLDTLAQAADGAPEGAQVNHSTDDILMLSDILVDNPAFLVHLHALALEWQLTERLQARLALDPVLSPLLQSLISSQDCDTAALAMKFLASQARFCQAQRRMKLPLCELPGDLLHGVLLAMRTLAQLEEPGEAGLSRAESQLRDKYDEGATRLGMIECLVSGMGEDSGSARSVARAGVAMFLSGLSMGCGQDRDSMVVATNEAQAVRLALSLCAAGLQPEEVEEQFIALHPDTALPGGFEHLDADRAASILAAGGGYSW